MGHNSASRVATRSNASQRICLDMHGVSPARRWPSTAPAALDITAAICVLAGNTITGLIFPSNWFVVGLSVPLLAGLALVVVRCILWPSPSPFRTWWPRIAPSRGRVLLLAVATRAAVLAAGLIVSLLQSDRLADKPRISTDTAVTLPARVGG